jgi:hypothetical protein
MSFARQAAKLVAWAEALALTATAVAVGPAPAKDDWNVDALAVELNLSQRSAQNRATYDRTVTSRFSLTHRALAAGDISPAHLRIMVEHLAPLPDDQAKAVEVRLLERAPGQTAANLARSARRAVRRLLPQHSRERALEDRHAWMRELGDDLYEFGFTGPYDRVATAWETVKTAADEHVPGDDRTLDQRRADVAADLITGRSIPTTTLVIHADHDDLGPLLTDLRGEPLENTMLRRLMAHGTVRWHDPTATPAATDGYVPDAKLDRWIRHQDRRCIFPGCTIDHAHADVHHVKPYRAGGTTSADNLALLCRHHHRLVHETDWELRLDPGRIPRWRAPALSESPRAA